MGKSLRWVVLSHSTLNNSETLLTLPRCRMLQLSLSSEVRGGSCIKCEWASSTPTIWLHILKLICIKLKIWFLWRNFTHIVYWLILQLDRSAAHLDRQMGTTVTSPFRALHNRPLMSTLCYLIAGQFFGSVFDCQLVDLHLALLGILLYKELGWFISKHLVHDRPRRW